MTPTPHEIWLEARRLGLSLEIYGDKLRVKGKYCPPEFEAVLLEHKAAIMAWLAAPKDQLALGKYPPSEFADVADSFPEPDRSEPGNRRHIEDRTSPWIHIARQVNCGEWDGADDSTRQSLNIGLRSLIHPAARAALERLRLEKGGV